MAEISDTVPRCTLNGWHVPTYHEGLSREWNAWLVYWADIVLTHYYPNN